MHHFSFKHFLDHAHAIGLAHFSPYKLHHSHACWQRRKHPAIYNYPRHPKTLQTYQSEVHRLLDEFTEESFAVSSKYQGNDCVYGGEARSELLSSRPDPNGRGDPVLRQQIGSKHSRDERLNCLDSTASFCSSSGNSARLVSPFPFFFPSCISSLFLDVPPGGATVLHATPMRPV